MQVLDGIRDAFSRYISIIQILLGDVAADECNGDVSLTGMRVFYINSARKSHRGSG